MATIRDIAQRAGISIGTVDRILHNRGRFSIMTAQKVRRIMDELDYRPNVLARHLSQAREYRVGVLLPKPDQDSGYWSMPLDGIRRAERELRPFNLGVTVFHFDRYDAASFARAGRRLVSGAFDGVLMAPLLDVQARKILSSIPPETPVVFVDTDLPGARRMSYIGQDSLQSGRLAARLMDLLTGGTRDTLIVAPETINPHLESRIRGFQDHISTPAQLVRVAVELDHDLPAFCSRLGRTITERTAGVFVVDAAAHFTAEYLSGAVGHNHITGRTPAAGSTPVADGGPTTGRGDRIKLIGYDLVPENRRWMEAGVIDVLLTQRPAAQGYRGLHSLYRRIFLDQTCAERIYTPIDIAVRENLAYLTEEETT